MRLIISYLLNFKQIYIYSIDIFFQSSTHSHTSRGLKFWQRLLFECWSVLPLDFGNAAYKVFYVLFSSHIYLKILKANVCQNIVF